MHLGTDDYDSRTWKIVWFLFKNSLIEIYTVGNLRFYSLIESYESAIADAILDHGRGLYFDTVIVFNDYPPDYAQETKCE